MNILITGASGYLGNSIVPYLLKRGHTILLVSRSKFSHVNQFLGIDVLTYDELFSSHFSRSFDCCIHLAVLNNSNILFTYEDFYDVNVRLGVRILDYCLQNGVKRFIYFGSAHEFHPGKLTPYSQTKRCFSAISQEYTHHFDVINICIPAAYDLKSLPKRLLLISRFNPLAKGIILDSVKIFWPLCSTDRLYNTVEIFLAKDSKSQIHHCADDQDDNPIYIFLKKALDITGSLLTIFSLWWLFLLIWIVIKIDGDGPSILRQIRVGKNRTIFTCYKFRTMQIDAPVAGTHDVSTSFVTRPGRLLRQYKIDELPQVLNVLRGEMSFVGPRPCLPIQNTLIEERDRRGVFGVLPGITGYSQVRGFDMSNPVMLAESDNFYVVNRTIVLDLIILFRTIFRGKKCL